MTRRFRSQREEFAYLREAKRAAGWSWKQIADHIRETKEVNSRIAFRLAHGLTQLGVADRWNELWPAGPGESPLTDKNISYWESWPSATGRPPSIETLNRLARIYCCDAADLLDGENHSALDELATQASRVPTERGQVEIEPQALVPSVPLHDEFAFHVVRQLNVLSGIGSEGPRLTRQREAAYEQLVQFLVGWVQTTKYREVLQVFGWAATAAAATPLQQGLDPDEQERIVRTLQTPSRVDEEVIGHIENALWHCIRQDDALGAQATLDTVLAQRSLVRLIKPECPDLLLPRLLSLYSNLSLQAGWLSYDLNDFQSAAYYYEHARTTAHDAQNTRLGALVLCTMSHLATWQGNARVGIDHAVAAQNWAGQPRTTP